MRSGGTSLPDRMLSQARWGALSVVLIVAWGHPVPARGCPHPCACYVPSEVHCTFRSLAAVPAGISKHVERINLGFNSIQALSENSFAGLTKLELLMIHGNDIPSIPDGALRDLSSLQVFKFSYNKVRVVTRRTLQGLSSLLRLHLDHNRIEFIHPQAFQGLLSLRLLHLEGNALHQLHPDTFSTFTFLDHFSLSTVRHLYLADNALAALPERMLRTMPLLENLYLHGNPWACDCRMRWLLGWDARSRGVLKCKKDKAYAGGQLCASCSSPRKLQTQELLQLTEVPCLKPSIESPLRPNQSHVEEQEEQEEEEEQDPEDVGDSQLSPQWHMTLNMTDEHRNVVLLQCSIRRPRELHSLQLNHSDPAELELNATVALELQCPMSRENYEKLWKLIAYYSEVPVRLHREQLLSQDPGASYRYRQDADAGALYYTGVRAQVLAQPAWVLQPSIEVQLNRRRSTAQKVLLSYYAHFSRTVSAKDSGAARSASWVMIEPGAAARRARTVLEGERCVLTCKVQASESPDISWVLPDGSTLNTQTHQQDSRFSLLGGGELSILSMQQADSGLYQCVAQVRDEVARMAHRVVVTATPAQSLHIDTVTVHKDPGESVTLPCSTAAIPEAQVTWVLPNRRVISEEANTSHAFLLPNGTLSIPKLQLGDGGYYSCVAVNLQGADQYTVGVTVNRRGSARSPKRGRRPGAKGLPRARGDVVEDEGGSGTGEEEELSRRILHPKDQQVALRTKDEGLLGDKMSHKGRRKLKLWKHPEKEPEATMAEGRRVFESRRRINMENKQINPERWADILARVRGKNLSKGTEGPRVVETTTSPSLSVEVTPLSPAPSSASESLVHPAPSVEGSSGDGALFPEDDQVPMTVSSTRVALEQTHDAFIPEGPQVTDVHLEKEGMEDEWAEKTQDVAPTQVNEKWVTVSTLRMEPEESSALQKLDTVYEDPSDEQTVTLPDLVSLVEMTTEEDETPLQSVSLAESDTVQFFQLDLETHSEPTSAHFPPTPVAWVADVKTAESLGEPDVPALSHQLGSSDNAQLQKSTSITQPPPRTPQGMEEKSQKDPSSSRASESEGQDTNPSPVPQSTLASLKTISLLGQPRVPTAGSVLDQGSTTSVTQAPTQKPTSPSPPATPSSRRRPNGRRRLRPHKFRNRHKQTSAPTESSSAPPTQTPEMHTSHPAPSSPVPTCWGRNTCNSPTQMDVGRIPELVSKGTPRRKNGKRLHKHRSSTSPASSLASVSKPTPSPANTHTHFFTPTLGRTLAPGTVPLNIGGPNEVTGADDVRRTTEIPSCYDEVQHTSPLAHASVSDGKEIPHYGISKVEHYQTDTLVPSQPLTNVWPTSASLVSTVEDFKEESPLSTPGVSSWNPPRTAQDGTTQIDTAATDIGEDLTHAPFLKELEDVEAIFEFSPSFPASTLFQLEDIDASTTVSNIQVAWSSIQGEATTGGQDYGETPVVHAHSETGPQNPMSNPTMQNLVSNPTQNPILNPMQNPILNRISKPTQNPISNPMQNPIWNPMQNPTQNPISNLIQNPISNTIQNRILNPMQLQDLTSPFPSTMLGSLGQTTSKPPLVTPRTSPTPAEDEKHAFLNFVGSPETKGHLVVNEGTHLPRSPDRLSTPSSQHGGSNSAPWQDLEKESFDSRNRNHLPRGHEDGRLHISQPPARDTAKPVLPRGTARPPYMATQSSVGYVSTFQTPRHSTSKSETTANPSRVLTEHKYFTTPKSAATRASVLLHQSKPGAPGTFTLQRVDQPSGESRGFGSNIIPESRSPVGEFPRSRVPPYSGGRFPSFMNRTLSFPQLGVTFKPQASSSAVPVTRDRKGNPSPFNRVYSQSIHVDFGPPAPPILRPPRTTAAPSSRLQNIPLVYPTRSSIPFMTSPGHPSGTFHQGTSKFFAGGPSTSKFWMLGEKPQIITKSPKSVSITAEADFVFPCEATGKPKPLITWTKVSTGALLTPNTRTERFEVLPNGTLVIRQVQNQDRGQYLCTASNAHGVDKMLVPLSVSAQQPQMLASRYQDVTVSLGDTVAMECVAKGSPAPRISWVFPDRSVWAAGSRAQGRVTLHENRTLSIRDAAFGDRGVYRCVASNAAGADSLAIRLHVAALPPVIRQDAAERISLPAGLSVHVHCSAKAAPPPSVRWVLPDGTQVRPSQFLRGNLFVFPNGTLFIRNLAPDDSGRYECVATNLVGSARRTVQLSVQRAASNARITGSSPRSTHVAYGGTLRLHCTAAGEPGPRILWRLPSKRMIDALFSFDTRVKVFTNGTLLVKSVTEKDAGDYLCVARNKVGDDYVLLKVNVEMKPAKIQRKADSDQRVLYGGDLRVDCVATGLPDPEISWSLPDGSLVNALMQADDSGARSKRYVVFNNGTLYFNDVGLREEGDYTCFAENQVGKDEMRVRIKVVAEPAAIRSKAPTVVQVAYGEVVTVACEAKGEPVPKVTWLSPTNRLIPASSDKYQVHADGTLLIRKAQRSDSGNYTCLVRTSAGEDRKSVWIQVNVQAPRINGHHHAMATAREIAPVGSRQLIPCRAQGIPTPRVLWALPEGMILPAPYQGNRVTVHSNGTLDLRSVRKTDSGQLVCIARNEGGEARLLVQFTVLEALEKPVFRDPVSEKITAMAGHTISLNCSAAGTPPPTLLWVLPNGTELRGGQQLQRFYHKADGMLHISGLRSGDAGAYRCVARNTAGHSERLVSLKVGLKPEPSTQFHKLVSTITGEDLQLHCAPPGGRQGRFSWTLPNGVTLDSPQALGRFSLLENGTLTVREASVFDRGTYTCRMDTEYGSLVISTPVIVIAYPPRITSEPMPVVYTRPGSTVKMNCMAMGVPKAEITWDLPDKSHLTAGTQARLYGNRYLHPQGSLTIQQATHRDAGFYKCTARNILGTDSKTTYIHVY